jgi:hypothetical protein
MIDWRKLANGQPADHMWKVRFTVDPPDFPHAGCEGPVATTPNEV